MTTETQFEGGESRVVDLYRFEGADVWQEGDDSARLRGYFPLTPGMPNGSDAGASESMLVCIEIEPGNHLPTHTDSNEELLLVTAGNVKATIDDSVVELSAGQVAVVPEMAPHSIECVGDEPARVIGFFPNDELTATFEEPLMPFESAVVSIGGGPTE